jgi:hypothetical protein
MRGLQRQDSQNEETQRALNKVIRFHDSYRYPITA